ncbi:MAG TPA: hypothetical protein VG737_11855 [Cyclobacteriaceae bacterium]|nr:hypothetical protein [Cyclobacteriaceae bacterium]
MRKVFILCLLFVYGVSSAQEAQVAPIARSKYFNFYSNRFVDAHHSFYFWMEKAEKQKLKDVNPLIDSLELEFKTKFSSEDRKSLVAVLGFYRKNFAGKDLLFNDTLYNVKTTLKKFQTTDDLKKSDMPLFFKKVFGAAMPVFEKYIWPSHSKTNLGKIGELIDQMATMEGTIGPELERVYQATWSPAVLEVMVTYYANWAGAYTAFSGKTIEITFSSSDPALNGTQGVEILFHEASHWLVLKNVKPLIDEKAMAQKKRVAGQQQLWHAVLFYITGKVVQNAYAVRGIDHELYMVKNKVFNQGFSRFPAALDPYIDGTTDLGAAIEELVRISRAE